ncbi:MAG: hypothetical protein V8R61_08080 [Enterocloster sp.]
MTRQMPCFPGTGQLHKKLGYTPVAERLEYYEMAKEMALERDDLMIEYITLQNLSDTLWGCL